MLKVKNPLILSNYLADRKGNIEEFIDDTQKIKGFTQNSVLRKVKAANYQDDSFCSIC